MMEKLFPTKLPHPGPLVGAAERFLVLLQTSLPSLPFLSGNSHFKRDHFWEIPLQSIDFLYYILHDNILIFGNLWKDISVMIDFSFLDSLRHFSSGSSTFLLQALPCLNFCLKLGRLPISTSIYVAFTSHETAAAGLRNYLATKPHRLYPTLPLKNHQLALEQCA